MPSTASSTYSENIEGKLITAITTSTTTGVTFKIKQINSGVTPTCPTAAFRLHIVQRTGTTTKVEKFGVAAGTTQSGQTVTLGTLTRALPLTNGTDFTGSGTPQSFAAGADVFLTWDSHDAAQSAKLDIANTFTGVNTFSSGLIMTATDKAFVPPTVTTTQRDAIAAPSNGMIVYNSTTGVMNQYISGAWTTFASGTTANAANGTGGKVDIASISEAAAETATDVSSGAVNVIPVGLLKQSSSGAAQGNVVALNASTQVDSTLLPTVPATKGGTGLTTGTTAYSPVFTGTTATGTFQTGTAGSSDQVLTSNGAAAIATFQTPKTYVKMGVSSGINSGTLTNPVATTALDTYTVSIPANFLTATTGAKYRAFFTINRGTTTTCTLSFMLGSNNAVTIALGSAGAGSSTWIVDGVIHGTAAAGSSVVVDANAIGTVTGVAPIMNSNGSSFATNGTLTAQFGAIFGSSNSGNDVTINNGYIELFSQTASTFA